MAGIEIHVAPDREPLYREALGRLRIDEQFEALITDDPIRAAKASGTCLLDRPECLEPEQFETLNASAKRIMPAHRSRFLPEVIPIRAARDAGKLGDPGLLRSHLWVSATTPTEHLAFDHLDLANCLFGIKAELVHCLRKTDYLQLHLGFPNDGMALIDIATNRPGADSYFSMHLIGSDGAIYADDHRNAQLLFTSGGTQTLVHRANLVLATQQLLAEFISGDWSVSLADSIAAQQCVQEVGNV